MDNAMNAQPKIRPMTDAETRALIEWAAAEGWNPGRHDAETFRRVDPEGFVAVESEGELVGGGSIVRHDPSFGFMGLFLVRPEFRGRGLGARLWIARRDMLLARLAPGASIGMDAVESMIPFYTRGGFRPHARGRRYRSRPDSPIAPPADDPRLVDARELPREAIAAFDRSCFPSPRENYLRAWLDQPEAIALALVEQGGIKGLGVMRPCRVGWKIGPLFSENRARAEPLLTKFLNLAGGSPVFLDVSESNPDGIALCEQFGMDSIFSYVRMYLGPTPTYREDRVFSVTSLELG